MEKMFSSMLERFTKGMSEEDKKKMKAYGEQMVGMCPCMTGKQMSTEEKKAMAEQIMACCGAAQETMSGFFKEMGPQTDKTDKPENS